MTPEQEKRKTIAYAGPFVVFMAFTLLMQFGSPLFEWDHPAAPWWQRHPEQWIYPLQTLACLILLIIWRKNIDWDWKLKPALTGIVFGIAGISIWLLPTMIADRLSMGVAEYFGNPSFEWYRYFLGIDSRDAGFNPSDAFTDGSAAWLASLSMRFVRAVVVVALVEELFWRGYLMRLMVNDNNPWKVPFGTHSWRAYWVTTLFFVIVHTPVDYPGAFFYGSLAYLLTVLTKNLGAVIIMHAAANLLLGWAAMSWQKFGLW